MEAAMVFPLVMLCFWLAVNGGIELHQEIKMQAEAAMEKEPLDVIACMYRKEYMEKLI